MKFVVSAQHRYAKYLFLPCMYKKHVDKLGWENTATVMGIRRLVLTRGCVRLTRCPPIQYTGENAGCLQAEATLQTAIPDSTALPSRVIFTRATYSRSDQSIASSTDVNCRFPD
jgi:hypothetical protein